MTEFQVVVIVSLYLFVVLTLAICLAFDSVRKRLRRIEELLTASTNQSHGNDETTDCEDEDE